MPWGYRIGSGFRKEQACRGLQALQQLRIVVADIADAVAHRPGGHLLGWIGPHQVYGRPRRIACQSRAVGAWPLKRYLRRCEAGLPQSVAGGGPS